MKQILFALSVSFALGFPFALNAESAESFTAWKARLESTDEKVQDAALKDWINGYVAADANPDDVVSVCLPFIKNYAVERKDIAFLGLLIEKLSRQLGDKARATIPDLSKLALDDSAMTYMRGQAVEALGHIGNRDPKVIEVLINVLENPKPVSSSGVHERAAEALGKMGAAAESARPALMKLLEHQWDIFNSAAFIALGRIAEAEMARPLDEQIARLGKLGELSVSEASAAFLVVEAAGEKKDPQAKMALPHLANILTDEGNPYWKSAAIRALIAIGPGSEPSMVKALLKATLKDGFGYANRALTSVDGKNPEGVGPLVEALKEYYNSQNWTDSYYISQALERFGANAHPAVPWIIKALLENNSQAEQVQTYIHVLTNAGAQDPETLPALLNVLSTKSDLMKRDTRAAHDIRCQLLYALSIIGIPHEGRLREDALKQIAEGLKSDDAEIFTAAASASAMTGAEEMVSLLMRGLDETVKFKHPYDEHRSYELTAATAAASALEKFGPLAADALPKISEIAARTPSHGSYDFKLQQAAALIAQARKTKAAIERK